MRAGRTHKNPVERSLVAVRAHIGAALEALDEEEAQSSASDRPSFISRVSGIFFGEDPQRVRGSAREELEAAEKALRSAELQLAGSRMKEGGALRAFSQVQDEKTREWLVSHFAEHTESASEEEEEGEFEIDGADAEIADDAIHRDESGLAFCRTRSKRLTHRRLCVAQGDAAVHSALTAESVRRSLDRATFLDFDAIRFCCLDEIGGRPISALGVHVEAKFKLIQSISSQGKISDLKEFQSRFLSFLGKLDSLYKPDSVYHGSMHAVDVMSTVMFFLNSEYLSSKVKKLDTFMALVAGAVHDVGHPGVNNLFLMKTMDPLALRYSDRSVLESMHLAITFETMATFQICNWFGLLDTPSQKSTRSGLINMVLATDMAKHAKHTKMLEELDPATDDLSFVLETVLHAADISNPAKPLNQMLGWTKLITEEFWRQGDEESRLSLEISPMCDREDGMKTVPKGQIGFISFVVQPFLAGVCRVIPETQEALDLLARNKEFWSKTQEEEKSYEEIFADTQIPSCM